MTVSKKSGISFSLVRFAKTTRSKDMPIFFSKIKNEILGKEYDLSFSFIGSERMRKLNREYRGKDYATDILSFPLEKNAGEIFICKTAARPKSHDFGRTLPNYLAFLFIHGLCHLKGMRHGATMERQEQKIRKQFGI